MSFLEIIASPEFAFLISLLVTLSIYYCGKKISPPFKPNKDKVAPYACGEDLPPRKGPMKVLFFLYATLFLIFDIVAMVVVFSMGIPLDSPLRLVVINFVSIYIFIVLLALYVLIRGRPKHVFY